MDQLTPEQILKGDRKPVEELARKYSKEELLLRAHRNMEKLERSSNVTLLRVAEAIANPRLLEQIFGNARRTERLMGGLMTQKSAWKRERRKRQRRES